MLYIYSILIFIAFLVFLLILFVLFINMKVVINSVYTKEERFMNVKLSILKNLIHFNFTVPLKRPKEVKEDVSDLEKKRDISVFQQIDFFINLYSNGHTIITKFLRSVQIYNLTYHIHFGVGNSALTGISIGTAYSAIGILENLLSKFTVLHHPPTIDITPNYYTNIMETTGKIRFSFSVRKAVFAGLLFLKAYLKTRKEFKATHPIETN
ncbi:hypothetical protein CN692_11265 [Bacillus sp. AFS002410]|nr:hypothetical protein CN692_11265 [Bacillus sp. AFS002410]